MRKAIMQKRKLGKSEIEVSALGIGCWAIGGIGWSKVDDDESVRALAKALELGVNFFDTADGYGSGHSEELFARACHGIRPQGIIAT